LLNGLNVGCGYVDRIGLCAKWCTRMTNPVNLFIDRISQFIRANQFIQAKTNPVKICMTNPVNYITADPVNYIQGHKKIPCISARYLKQNNITIKPKHSILRKSFVRFVRTL
jgi:hypothetical protein